MDAQDLTVAQTAQKYLETVRLARLQNTATTYGKALKIFHAMLSEKGLDPERSPTAALTEDHLADFALYLKDYAPATERLYLQAAQNFYKFLSAHRLADINLPRLELLLKSLMRRPGIRIPLSPIEEIERLLAAVESVEGLTVPSGYAEAENINLRAYRDRAFLLTLADTGFRVHEACQLRRGDMNWNEGYAVIIGKGDKQALVRFTSRALDAIQDYIKQRARLDGGSGKPLASLPIFARHDRAAGKKVKPMTPTAGRNIVNERVLQFLGPEAVGKITPHTFRHYFVTSALRATGNLRIAQELARHKNIQVTEKYTHLVNQELDQAYYEAFEKRLSKAA